MNKIKIIALSSVAGLALAGTVFAVQPWQRLDFVNLGTSASQTVHNAQGWGPAEPETNGGGWGGIATETDCGLTTSTDCDKLAAVTYAAGEPDKPAVNGRMATVTLNPVKNKWGIVRAIKIRALDGAANDDFMVFIKNKRGNWENIYTYASDPSTAEIWKIHEINLPLRNWFNKPLELGIMSTASDWASKSTYGQLGIDWIELVGNSPRNNKPCGCHANGNPDCED